MDTITLILFLSGLVGLSYGADLLVRGASRLARMLGISSLVIGLTVVAFGTSAPELAVSIHSGLTARPDVAFGNIIGSNILNILLILGASATITPLIVSPQLIRLDVPLLILISALTYLFSTNSVISHFEGGILFAALVVYTVFLLKKSRREHRVRIENGEIEAYSHRHGVGYWLLQAGYVVGGLGLLVIGSRWFVDGAVELARSLGVSELVIGLTIVALGTSLPEVATSIVAAIRGERDIAVGNVIGSCLFNLLAVLGIAAIVTPGGIAVSPDALRLDLPVMIAITLLCIPVFITHKMVERWEGLLFLGYYLAYTVYLFLANTGNDHLHLYNTIIFYGAIPLTVLSVLLSLWYSSSQRSA